MFKKLAKCTVVLSVEMLFLYQKPVVEKFSAMENRCNEQNSRKVKQVREKTPYIFVRLQITGGQDSDLASLNCFFVRLFFKICNLRVLINTV